MQKLFKFSTLIVVLFIGLLITGCGTAEKTDETPADSDTPVIDDKAEPEKTVPDTSKPETVKPETVRPTSKKPLAEAEEEVLDVEKAYKEFVGSEEELYARIKYPGYWRLTKIPGIKVIPGIDAERWCKFRFESLDASIEITVLEGERDLDKIIPQLKKRILKRYSLDSFLELPPRLVAIGDEKVEDKETEGGTLDTVIGEDNENEEDLPDFDGVTDDDDSQTQPEETDDDDEELDDDLDLDDDDDLDLDDDDDLDLDDDDDLDLDDDDDLDLDDDDDLDLDDDDDLDLDDDDDLDLDDDDEMNDDDDLDLDDDVDDDEVKTEKGGLSKGAKIFKRNEVWLKGKEMWSKTGSHNSASIRALEYEGRFVYDQKLFLIKVYAVNYKKSSNTYYSIFVCEAENFVRYEVEYRKTVQNVSFPKKNSSEE
ncbi:MAG: hypothetical protein K8S87_01350 [Planctomycetes bacterium]|nr:hypothetical protein [Planctomycetota bacterium]